MWIGADFAMVSLLSSNKFWMYVYIFNIYFLSEKEQSSHTLPHFRSKTWLKSKPGGLKYDTEIIQVFVNVGYVNLWHYTIQCRDLLCFCPNDYTFIFSKEYIYFFQRLFIFVESGETPLLDWIRSRSCTDQILDSVGRHGVNREWKKDVGWKWG